MKKLFTLALALLGMTTVANAAGPDDIVETKHSMVMVFDQYTGNGTGARTKGALFGAKHFLDVTGGSVATNKGGATLGDATTLTPFNCTQEEVEALAAKYAKYDTPQLNSLRLKNDQDVIAAKFTAGSVIWIIGQGNNKSGKDARIPKISSTDAKLSNPLNEAPTEESGSTPAGYVYKWTCPDDGLYYIGSYNGDAFFSYIVVEANEAPGTPKVEVGAQTFADGRWFVEVSAEAVVAEGMETVVYYTTDGSAVVGEDGTVSATAAEYTAPVKMYQDGTVKFQAFYKDLLSLGLEAAVCPNADNEGTAEFQFAAPTIKAEGGNVTITTEYENATNYVSVNGAEATATNTVTLELSATIAAYTVIDNGEGIEFTTLTSTKDVYVLNPITEKKTIVVTGGTVEVDEEATANATDGQTVYKVVDGTISADPTDFFVKNLTFATLLDREKDKLAQYQINGQEIYIQMSNTNISFFVKDSVNVKVVCPKPACKTFNPTNDEDVATDRKCYVNVNGTTYGHDNCTYAEDGKTVESWASIEDMQTTIEFGLQGGEEGKIFTFQKYSGTGNILIYSIEIAPAEAAPAEPAEIVVKATEKVAEAWDNQFWIVANRVVEAGETTHISFEYKADAAATGISTQCHAAPGEYIHWWAIGSVDFTEDWQTLDMDFVVPNECEGKGFKSIAFNLNDHAPANNYYFRNFTWTCGEESLIVNGDLSGDDFSSFVQKIANGAPEAWTGIDEIKSEAAKTNVMFNLNGQRVNNAKGLVIMNGKIMFVK